MSKSETEFQDWIKKVDAIISTNAGGMSSADLPDICYRDMFEDEETPKAAARAAIKNAKDE